MMPEASEDAAGAVAMIPSERTELLLNEDAPPISEQEYQNLEEMMTLFCRVPFLHDFSRPTALLYPEIAEKYAKIVRHPIDLGIVCRGIRSRQYKCLRDVRLDVWRVFANCVKYHSHPTTDESLVSISVALHLREYFNMLWQEYMLPSDLPAGPTASNEQFRALLEVLMKSHSVREKERQKRMKNLRDLELSETFTTKIAARILEFVETRGLVDKLDTESIWGEQNQGDTDIDIVVQRLRDFHSTLLDAARTSNLYTVDSFYRELQTCYTNNILRGNASLRHCIASRLDRLFWKYAIPLHEASSRGLMHSSIWGNVKSCMWSRQGPKQPYWPALCLGILPPSNQCEAWHDALTECNENRLPDRLRAKLEDLKEECKQEQKLHRMSYFLIEFMGSHDFGWMRETDTIANFDPKNDPNKNDVKALSGKKFRLINSSTYKEAVEELQSASSEYEDAQQDVFEFADDENGVNVEDGEDGDNKDVIYSFELLAQSDDEANSTYNYSYSNDKQRMGPSDAAEANCLLSHDGMLDSIVEGPTTEQRRSKVVKEQAAFGNNEEPNTEKPLKMKNHSTDSANNKKAIANDEENAHASKSSPQQKTGCQRNMPPADSQPPEKRQRRTFHGPASVEESLVKDLEKHATKTSTTSCQNSNGSREKAQQKSRSNENTNASDSPSSQSNACTSTGKALPVETTNISSEYVFTGDRATRSAKQTPQISTLVARGNSVTRPAHSSMIPAVVGVAETSTIDPQASLPVAPPPAPSTKSPNEAWLKHALEGPKILEKNQSLWNHYTKLQKELNSLQDIHLKRIAALKSLCQDDRGNVDTSVDAALSVATLTPLEELHPPSATGDDAADCLEFFRFVPKAALQNTELIKVCGKLENEITGMKERRTKLQELSRKVIELAN